MLPCHVFKVLGYYAHRGKLCDVPVQDLLPAPHGPTRHHPAQLLRTVLCHAVTSVPCCACCVVSLCRTCFLPRMAPPGNNLQSYGSGMGFMASMSPRVSSSTPGVSVNKVVERSHTVGLESQGAHQASDLLNPSLFLRCCRLCQCCHGPVYILRCSCRCRQKHGMRVDRMLPGGEVRPACTLHDM